jgi:hypothetical protein
MEGNFEGRSDRRYQTHMSAEHSHSTSTPLCRTTRGFPLKQEQTPPPICLANLSPGLKHRYLAVLERRIASSREHLYEIVSLAEELDSEMERHTAFYGLREVEGDVSIASTRDHSRLGHADSPNGAPQEIRPLLAVDKTELEQDVARLLRQIALL